MFFSCLAIIGFWLYSNNELDRIEEELSYLVTEVPEGEEQERKYKSKFRRVKKDKFRCNRMDIHKRHRHKLSILQTDDNEYYLKKSINKNILVHVEAYF